MRNSYLLLIIFTILLACNSKKKNPVLDEAYEIHKSVIEVQKEVILQWKTLKELGKPDLEATIIQNKANYESWKHDLLEVPGYPHIHIEGDDHDHHHHDQVNLPDEKILEVQSELKKRIEEIYSINKQLIDSL